MAFRLPMRAWDRFRCVVKPPLHVHVSVEIWAMKALEAQGTLTSEPRFCIPANVLLFRKVWVSIKFLVLPPPPKTAQNEEKLKYIRNLEGI